MARSPHTQNAAVSLRRNPLARIALASLGFTLIYSIWLIKQVVEPSQYGFYHWSGSAESFFVPCFLDVLVVWLLIAMLLLLARKPGRTRVVIWTGLILFIPSIFIKLNIFYHRSIFHHRLDSEVPVVVGAALLTLLLTATWRPSFAERFERVLAHITTVMIFLGLLGAFVLCQMAWYGARGLMAESSPLHHQKGPPTVEPHRVIWIVFDELSYQQTYEHRYPGLQLPAFDALAADSTVFTTVTPFDIYTEIVLPGLLSGKPFDAIRTSSAAEPSVHNEVTGKWQAFQPHDTVFQDALDDGYRTAVAGWWNPYCRILPAVLDSCYWTFQAPLPPSLSRPGVSVLSNALAPLDRFARIVLASAPTPVRTYLAKRLRLDRTRVDLAGLGHVEDYKYLSAVSDRLLRDRSYGFVLLHLPVPHPGGIYDRKTGKFVTDRASYIDNLALADKCLASLRATLEQTGQWDSTAIVVMGDHSWRTAQMWKAEKHEVSWGQEDIRASNGWQYDPRPAYIVKLPGQTTAARIDSSFHAVNTRKLFDQLLTHQITTPAELSAWAQNVH